MEWTMMAMVETCQTYMNTKTNKSKTAINQV